MFIFYGIRHIRIRTIRDDKKTCSACEGHEKVYRVYQPCVHIFWIPLFPVPGKYMVESCPQCKSRYETVEHPLLSETRTPIYTFALTFILLAFIVNMYFDSKAEGKRNIEYVAAPLSGDVYLIKDTIEGTEAYYFSKVLEVEPDSVIMSVGAYNYSKYVSKMNKEDYFVSEYLYAVPKTALKDWLDKKKIREIKRSSKKKQ